MFRKVLLAIGAIEILAPERIVERAESLALEDPGGDGCGRKWWVVPVGRLEGLLFVSIALRGGSAVGTFKTLLGVIGLLALFVPRRFVDSAASVAYTDADRCEWKSWSYTLSRVIGLVYVLVAIEELRDRSRSVA